MNTQTSKHSHATPYLTIPHLIARVTAKHPNAPALIDGTTIITYADLNGRANALAWQLQRAGVQPETLVGICLERSVNYVIGLLGILKAGGAYVPLDPAYPPARRDFMLRDAAVPVLVTRQGLADQFARAGMQTICLDALEVAPNEAAPPLTIQPDQLAYVIYTSGSTGQPKGVQITHANLKNLVQWHHHAFAVTARDRATHVAGVAFDAAGWEIWPYLTKGAALYLPGDDVRVAPAALRDWLLGQGITVTFLPTALAEQMLAQTWPAQAPLRLMLTGADTLRRHPPVGLPFALVNNYGPTECAVVATSGTVPPGDDATPPTIGAPIRNTEILLLDDALQPVADGEPGEIYIGGAGVARGYLNRPDLTAERFIKHPFKKTRGARLYKTGDRACRLADGQLAFLGRADEQIKLRGYRIEPGEIAQALESFAGVVSSVVVAREDETGEKRLVAYLACPSSGTISAAALRAHLLDRLPEYMIPSAFVALEALPLTANGKIDRAALPEPTPENTLRDEAVAAPTTLVEAHLSAIITELLGVGEISIDDNFFLLGGHSLLGTQAIAYIADAFGVEITLRTLFEAPTVRELATVVERQILAQLAPAEVIACE